MALSRRGFLKAVAQMGAVAATPQSLSPALEALAAAPVAATGGAGGMMFLLAKRQQLLVGSPESAAPSLDSIWLDYRLGTATAQEKYLAPVGWDASLLSPHETESLTRELVAHRRQYQSAANPVVRQIEDIDAVLRQQPEKVRAAMHEASDYYALETRMTKATPGTADYQKLRAQYEALPKQSLDAVTVEDVNAVIEGARPSGLNLTRNSALDLDKDVANITAELRSAAASRPNDWQERRRHAQMRYLSEELQKMARDTRVHMDCSLNRGYGDDKWSIASRMHSSEINDEADKELQFRFGQLERVAAELYPARAQQKNPPFLGHSRPEQPGYGEHDCERLTITNPDFALREMLRKAENTYLKRQNALNPTPKIA